MKLRRAGIFLIVVIIVFGWLLWNRPRRAEMAGYVPAESLAFVEVNDLPELAEGIVNTDAWKTLSSPSAASLGFSHSRWLTSLARWTGIGSIETVLLARSQFAISWMDVSQTETGTILSVKPVAALVVETHTTQFRMRAVLEKRIEELVHRKYPDAQLQRKTFAGVDLFEWSSPGATPQIVFAFFGTVVVIGNDERPVQACIAVLNGERPSLISSEVYNTLKSKLETTNVPVAIGFLSQLGLKTALPYLPDVFSRSSNSSNAPQLLANVAASLVKGIAWIPRFVNGAVEDHYIYLLADGVAQKMHDGIVPEHPRPIRFAELLPIDTKSFTQYNLRQPVEAWRGLNTAISLHADALSGIFTRQALANVLASYGVKDPDVFFGSIGPEISTVRLDNSESPMVIGQILDGATLSKQLHQRLGEDPIVERIGDAEISISRDPKGGAASLLGNEFLMGAAEDLRRSLAARAASSSISANESFKRAQQLLNPSALETSITFSSDDSDAISFVLLFSPNRKEAFLEKAGVLHEAAKQLPYSVKTTELNEDSVTQTSRSSFGLLGSLLARILSD